MKGTLEQLSNHEFDLKEAYRIAQRSRIYSQEFNREAS